LSCWGKQMRTLQDLSRDAIRVQDACNLSGVVHAFSRAMTELRAILSADTGVVDTDRLNTHYICKMWANKISHLSQTDDDFAQAFLECSDQANKKEVMV